MNVQAWFDDRHRGLLLLLLLAGGNLAMLPPWSDRGFTLPAQAAESTLSTADRLLDVAQQQYQKGQLREALETYQKALAIARQGGGSTGERLRQQDSEGVTTETVTRTTRLRRSTGDRHFTQHQTPNWQSGDRNCCGAANGNSSNHSFSNSWLAG